MRKEDVVVVWDNDTDDDLAAKYVILVDNALDRSDEKVGKVTKYVYNLGSIEVTIEGEEKEIVIDKKSKISNSDVDKTILVYTTKQDSNQDNVLTVISKLNVDEKEQE